MAKILNITNFLPNLYNFNEYYITDYQVADCKESVFKPFPA